MANNYVNLSYPNLYGQWDEVIGASNLSGIPSPPYNSKYDYYGNMSYPYYVKKHRIPKIYLKPKPRIYKSNNYYYQIPPYPPRIYFYNNPIECRDKCGPRACNLYHKRLNDFNNCKRCQNIKSPGPMCWSSRRQKCVPCPRHHALSRCEDRFGCSNPNGLPHDNVPPINPLYTGCKNCF